MSLFAFFVLFFLSAAHTTHKKKHKTYASSSHFPFHQSSPPASEFLAFYEYPFHIFISFLPLNFMYKHLNLSSYRHIPLMCISFKHVAAVFRHKFSPFISPYISPSRLHCSLLFIKAPRRAYLWLFIFLSAVIDFNKSLHQSPTFVNQSLSPFARLACNNCN